MHIVPHLYGYKATPITHPNGLITYRSEPFLPEEARARTAAFMQAKTLGELLQCFLKQNNLQRLETADLHELFGHVMAGQPLTLNGEVRAYIYDHYFDNALHDKPQPDFDFFKTLVASGYDLRLSQVDEGQKEKFAPVTDEELKEHLMIAQKFVEFCKINNKGQFPKSLDELLNLPLSGQKQLEQLA